MEKYLIINTRFPKVLEFFKQNFNPVTDVFAIGEFNSGVVLCTNDNKILQKFSDQGFSPTSLHNNVYAEMVVSGEDGNFTGHDRAIEGMKNSRIK